LFVGDTPTIYAGLQGGNKTDPVKEEGGMTIFGIPIPKIPFPILSFGLAPALSHGLLPIGRKGDPMSSGAANLVKELTSAVGRRQSAAQTTTDGTRGPDKLEDPIYVDETDSQSVEDYQEQLEPTKQEEQEVARPKRFGYLKPQNPIIPLNYNQQEDYESMPKYFPTDANQQQAPQSGDYYPKDFLPAIKFDHPVPASGLDSHRRAPVQPIPSLGPEPDLPLDRIQIDYASDEYQQNLRNVHRHTEDGFLPLFQPNNADPMYSKGGPSKGSPSIQFLPNDNPSDQTYPAPPNLGPSYAAVPKQQEPMEEEQLIVVTEPTTTEQLRKRPTKVPPTFITKFPLTPPPVPTEVEAPKEEPVKIAAEVEDKVEDKGEEEGEEEYEYEYEEDEQETAAAATNDDEIPAYDTSTTTTTTTEIPVSTLEVEEIFGQPAESHITETSVEIVHKGTPPENPEGSTENPDKSSTYEYEYYYEDEEESTKSSTSTIPDISTDSVLTSPTKQETPTTKKDILPKKADILSTSDNTLTEEETEENSTDKEDAFSLQSILDLMSGENTSNNNNNNNKATVPPAALDEDESFEQALHRPPPSPLTHQRSTPRPTLGSPIRTSTPNYDYGSNFLQVMSNVVQIEVKKSNIELPFCDNVLTNIQLNQFNNLQA
jgi:hypothetical protein